MSAPAPDPGLPVEGDPRPSRHAAALREHSLHALFELSRELSVRFDTRHVVDLVLLNLMGRFGTRHSALWLMSPEGDCELARAHGLAAGLGARLAAAFREDAERWSEDAGAVRIEDAGGRLDAEVLAAAADSGIALLAPLAAHGTILGFVAIGRRASGVEVTPFELEGLRSSLGMVAVAIENSRLYHELQERNERLADAYRDLVELDQMKTEFIQNVNHELRTPLTVISGSIDCLLNPPDADPRRHKLHAAIQAQADKLSSMVQSLLDLSVMTRHEESRGIEDVDVATLLEQYVTAHAGAVASGGRRLLFTPSPANLRARMARLRFAKVLDLLLDNAVKFTPAGTRIRLAASVDPSDARRVQVTFADDGPGIPPGELARVFQPFFQLDGSTTRAAGGLGIGLAVARRLLAAMSAQIDAERPPEGGLLFRLRLLAS